ncbi:hypothetical protein Nepgr_001003 [Nepenthes gracilis]|uniref:Uncharacterized protein n=1 Tax=Nepenthes gracilis TaxID=150966 RepID=A0AAD3RWM3_NEPGR|nr:hypothetical protein Nepgr_001003 [Nepenthes gracilis]
MILAIFTMSSSSLFIFRSPLPLMAIFVYLRELRRLSPCLLNFFTMCEAVSPICCLSSPMAVDPILSGCGFWVYSYGSSHDFRKTVASVLAARCSRTPVVAILPWDIGRAPSLPISWGGGVHRFAYRLVAELVALLAG